MGTQDTTDLRKGVSPDMERVHRRHGKQREKLRTETQGRIQRTKAVGHEEFRKPNRVAQKPHTISPQDAYGFFHSSTM